MESPVKKLNFEPTGKENVPVDSTVTAEPETKKPVIEEVKPVPEATKVVDVIKQQEAEEPLLQENPGRFVLFPIKYHEVCAH